MTAYIPRLARIASGRGSNGKRSASSGDGVLRSGSMRTSRASRRRSVLSRHRSPVFGRGAAGKSRSHRKPPLERGAMAGSGNPDTRTVHREQQPGRSSRLGHTAPRYCPRLISKPRPNRFMMRADTEFRSPSKVGPRQKRSAPDNMKRSYPCRPPALRPLPSSTSWPIISTPPWLRVRIS